MEQIAKPEFYIQRFRMETHPEGGYFVSTFCHAEFWHSNDSPEKRDRPLSTSILYLLKSGQRSKWHTLLSDELWFYHDGCPMLLHVFHKNGDYSSYSVGCPVHKTSVEQPIVHLPAGTIFAAEPSKENTFSLVSCVVSPGFDFADFAFVEKEKLAAMYPQHVALIHRLG